MADTMAISPGPVTFVGRQRNKLAGPRRSGEPDADDRNGGPLTAQRRNALPQSQFALPGGRYPINDTNHARNALSRGAQNASPDELARIRAAVHARYPGIK